MALVAEAAGGGDLGNRVVGGAEHLNGLLEPAPPDGLMKALSGCQPLGMRHPSGVKAQSLSEVGGRPLSGTHQFLSRSPQPLGRSGRLLAKRHRQEFGCGEAKLRVRRPAAAP
jgi:hypothetical protein